jgi:TRAP-type uncharacterized transport system substrate-binding protein
MSNHALPWAAFGLLCITLASLWWWEQPVRLKIAVSQNDIDEPRIVQALIDTLVKERADVRLSLHLTNGPEESAQALERGEVELAVVRSDIPVGRGATSIMELRKFFLMLVTKHGNHIQKIADLRGKQIGIAALPVHNRVIAAEVLLHWGLKEKDYGFVYLDPGDLQKVVKEGKVDALFAISSLTNRPARRASDLLRSVWGPQLTLIPFDDVAALVGKIRGVEDGELVKGYFGGSPAKPEEDLATISLSNRLVASEKVTIPVAVTITKVLLSLRDKKQLETPELISITVPARTSPSLPVHPGTVQQGDGTYQDFLDRYTNHFYVALAVIGGLGSLLTTLLTHGKHLVRDRSIRDVRQVLLLGDLLASDSDKASVALRLAEADKILQETLLACAAGEVEHSLLMAMQVAVARCHRASEKNIGA